MSKLKLPIAAGSGDVEPPAALLPLLPLLLPVCAAAARGPTMPSSHVRLSVAFLDDRRLRADSCWYERGEQKRSPAGKLQVQTAKVPSYYLMVETSGRLATTSERKGNRHAHTQLLVLWHTPLVSTLIPLVFFKSNLRPQPNT